MIKHFIQNLIGPRKLVCGECNESHNLSLSGDLGALLRPLHALREVIGASFRRQARAAEELEAIEHLHSLTDAQLRDMGISRMDISRAVRYGKLQG